MNCEYSLFALTIYEFGTVTEPFISPALYEEYVNSSSIPVVDEWSLSLAMGSDLATKMEAHYKTFIVSYTSY